MGTITGYTTAGGAPKTLDLAATAAIPAGTPAGTLIRRQGAVSRTNLSTNPGFEAGTTGWAAGANWTLGVATSVKHSGAQSMSATRANATAGNGYATTSFNVTSGHTYTVAFWAYGGSGNYNIQGPSPAVAVPFSAPGLAGARFFINWTASATASVSVLVSDDPNTAPTSGTVLYLDEILIEESFTLGPYFDGSTPGAHWTGAVNASTSVYTGDRLTFWDGTNETTV